MVDPKVQERFARRCTDAAFGYGTASTAAYFAFAGQVLDFWSSMLSPDPYKPKTAALPMPAFGWPVPAQQAAASPFFWPIPAPTAPALPAPSWPFFWPVSPPAATAPAWPFAPFPAAPAMNPFQSAFQAWFSSFPFASATPAWPMAFTLIAYGIPSSVAWPTAEANLAAIDAADAAATSMRQAFSSYRAETGHAAHQWPNEQLTLLAAFLPMGLGAMLAQVRMP